jgi:hypothetical protein
MRGDLTFLSLSRGKNIPPSRDNAERLRLMRARLTPVVGNGMFNFYGWKEDLRTTWENAGKIKVKLTGYL